MGHDRGWKGLFYYATQTSGKGTPVNPTLPTGDWENFRARIIGGVEPVRSAGSRAIIELVEGMTGVELSYDCPAVQASTEQATFLNLGIASPITTALSYVTLGWGVFGGTDKQVEDSKIDTISFNGDTEGNFTASVTAMGGKVATPSPELAEAQSYLTDDPSLQMHEAIYSEFELSGISGEYRNNLRMVPVIASPSTSRDPGRVWDYLTEGPIDMSGSYSMFNDSGKDLQGNTITAVSPVLRFVDKGASADELLLTITGLKPQDDTQSIPGDDPDIEWELPWVATALTWATTEY